MILFIIQFIFFSGLFYLVYQIFFSRLSFFSLNRFTLLLIPLLCLLIPWLGPRFSASVMPDILQPTLLSEVVLTTASYQTDFSDAANHSAWYIYAIGWLLLMFSIGLGVWRARKILRNSTPQGANIYLSSRIEGPFAYFNKIVLPHSLKNSPSLPGILAHERAHVAQKHSYDNLYYNLLGAFCWFNPFIFLLHKELRRTHEYLADRAALRTTHSDEYARILLSRVFGQEICFDLTHRFFNRSLIKTRITMLYKTKTKTKMKGLYLAFLPLIVLMIALSCNKQDDSRILNAQSPDSPNASAQTGLQLQEVDQPPLFDNCEAAQTKAAQMSCFQQGIVHYMTENFQYPDLAKKESLQGKIFVEFIIDQQGQVSNAKAVKWEFEGDQTQRTPTNNTGGSTIKLSPAADEALQYAENLIRALPDMQPALKDGKAVAVSFVLPVQLKLS